jgi:hypothetical protein
MREIRKALVAKAEFKPECIVRRKIGFKLAAIPNARVLEIPAGLSPNCRAAVDSKLEISMRRRFSNYFVGTDKYAFPYARAYPCPTKVSSHI